jgi:hypothetical protein
MSASRILTGILVLAVVIGPHALAAWRWQRALAPRTLPLRVLATTIIATALLLLTAELVGTFEAFETGWLIAASLVVGGAAYLLAARLAPVNDAPAEPGIGATARAGGWILWVAGAATAAVVVRWLSGMAVVVANGLHDIDSRNHHLTFSAEFIQTGSVTQLHPVYPDPFASLQPLNSELLQAIGMLAMDRDVLVPLISILWLGLLLFSGWCAGIRDGVSPLTLLGIGWLVGIPTVLVVNAGSAGNDVAAIACVAAAVALWRNSENDLGWLAVAGLALGLAIGVKVTAIAPAGVLAIAILWLVPRERRLKTAGVLAAGLAAGGAFWYLRLWARTGSPLPALDLPLFPSLDLPVLDERGYTFAHYLFDGDVWRDVYGSGFSYFFGLSGVIAAAAAIVAAPRIVKGRHRAVMALGACSLVCALVYLVTPAGAFGAEGEPDPVLFWVNLRYALPALTLLALTLGLALSTASSRLRMWYTGLLGLAVAAEVFRYGVTAATPEYMLARFTARGIALALLLAAGVFVLSRVRARPLFKWAAVGAAVLLAAVVAGPRVTDNYLEGATGGPDPAASEVYKWSRDHNGVHIGHYGLNPFYPLYGPAWENKLDYIGVGGRRSAFRSPRDCEEYVRVLADERFDYLVLAPSDFVFQDLKLPDWTETQPGAEKVLDASPYSVYRVAPPYDPARCRNRPS